MNFHAEFFPKPFIQKINHRNKLMLIGSCFTEQIGHKLSRYKFNVIENPHGILFNPVSIAKTVVSYAEDKLYESNDLFYYNELWGSWDHHTRFSNIEKEKAIHTINKSQQQANTFIKSADWLLLTLGSAFVYENQSIEEKSKYDNVVANCHKIPNEKFNRRLLDIEEIIKVLSDMIRMLKKVNQSINLIFTISPVRHLREGFIENNQSKSALIQAVHALVNNDNIFYFPAYELIIDDLRDYRFYAEDMVHPNYAATQYVWEKFVATAIDESSQELIKEINIINAARNHKPFNPGSKQHKIFLQTHLEKAQSLAVQYPYINLEKEIEYFKGE